VIRFLLLAGKDSQGHYSGKMFIALLENDVDKK
jgi:tetrahydromethanopterin S-methyltransferase subunit A